jgi:hypothetical protein
MLSVRAQSGGAFLNYHNDQNLLGLGLADGKDRGWTGGGALGFSIGGDSSLWLVLMLSQEQWMTNQHRLT